MWTPSYKSYCKVSPPEMHRRSFLEAVQRLKAPPQVSSGTQTRVYSLLRRFAIGLSSAMTLRISKGPATATCLYIPQAPPGEGACGRSEDESAEPSNAGVSVSERDWPTCLVTYTSQTSMIS